MKGLFPTFIYIFTCSLSLFVRGGRGIAFSVRLLFFFLASICISYGESFRGFVINVINGDTITVLEKTPEQKQAYKVRLKGVDAPEKGSTATVGLNIFGEVDMG